jgi:hypothetical protein
MGLGRHRSTRHGAVSQRAARRGARTGWLTREQAATYAGVHYNTIRLWERSGGLRTVKRPRVRGTLIDSRDLNRLMAERSVAGAPATGPSRGGDASVAVLEARFRELVDGLERLVASLKGPAPSARPRRRPGPANGSGSAAKRGTKGRPQAARRPARGRRTVRRPARKR